jgi:WD40 repeat protein
MPARLTRAPLAVQDTTIRLWDFQAASMQWATQTASHSAVVTAVALSLDGKLVATGSKVRSAVLPPQLP